MNISLNQPWSYLLAFQLLMTMTLVNKNLGAVCANAVTPEIPTVSDNENEFSEMMMSNDGPIEEKRNWQSLQGSWGKRSQNDNDFMAAEKRNWQSLQGSWGKRSQNDNDFRVAEKRNWQSLQGSWGKRSQNDNDFNGDIMDNDQMVPVLITTNLASKPKMLLAFLSNNQLIPLSSVGNNDIVDENIYNNKRGWKQMNAAWGKRRNAGQSWNRDLVSAPSSTGSWGKRETNWGNLKGMWGKR